MTDDEHRDVIEAGPGEVVAEEREKRARIPDRDAGLEVLRAARTIAP